MPQLEKVTFLSQYFWLCVFFLAFYVLLLKYFLPQMSRVLKYRKKRVNQSHHGVSGTQSENKQVRESTDTLLEAGLRSSSQSLKKNIQVASDWLVSNSNTTNTTQLKNTNYSYLHSLGEKSLSENLSLQGGLNDFSSVVFCSALFERVNSSPTRLFSDVYSMNKSKKLQKGGKGGDEMAYEKIILDNNKSTGIRPKEDDRFQQAEHKKGDRLQQPDPKKKKQSFKKDGS